MSIKTLNKANSSSYYFSDPADNEQNVSYTKSKREYVNAFKGKQDSNKSSTYKRYKVEDNAEIDPSEFYSSSQSQYYSLSQEYNQQPHKRQLRK